MATQMLSLSQPYDNRSAVLCILARRAPIKPENLVGDRAYDSDPLDEELRNDGIEMIAPHLPRHE
jgi:hypothetical protein